MKDRPLGSVIYASMIQSEKAHQLQIKAISYKKGKTSMENPRTQSEEQRAKEDSGLENDFQNKHRLRSRNPPVPDKEGTGWILELVKTRHY